MTPLGALGALAAAAPATVTGAGEATRAGVGSAALTEAISVLIWVPVIGPRR